MSLTVLQVAYPFAPVTADPAGGAEQVLAQIDRALVTAGHRSVVLAPEGSSVAGEVVRVPAVGGAIDDAARARTYAAVRGALAEAIARERPDVVHLHGIDFAAYLPQPGPPVLVTLHLPLGWYDASALRPARPRTWLQPVSASQAALGSADLELCPPIPNGVDLDHYRPGPKGDRALVLGRIAAEKGFHDAIDAARISGVPLDVAGKVFPYPDHQRYFAEQVLARLDGERRYVGPVEGEAKAALLREARVVLIPSTAAETSSLVAMEALASGTPVVAYRAGALPDIVEHGVTGYIVDDVAGMAEAIGRVDAIDPAECRAAACARFPLGRTTAAYLDLYQRLAA